MKPEYKKIETVPGKYFNMEEAAVRGFCNFCKNNIPLLIAVSVTLVFTYGIRLFWYTISIDTELFMADKSGMMKWHLGIGRFGHVLLSKFLHIKEFNPFTAFFTAFCLIWFFTISWCYIIAIFSRDTVKNYKLIPFALMFMTVPIWAEQFFSLLQVTENALIVSLCPYVVYLLFKGFLDSEKRKIICASVLLVLMISVYQTIVLLFCCGTFACFLLLQEHSDYEPKVYRNLCLKLLVTLVVSLAVYFFIDRVVIPAVFSIERHYYLENKIQWGNRTPGELVIVVLLFSYATTIGHIPLVQHIVNPLLAGYETNIIEFLARVSKICGNVLLLPAGVLFLVKVTQTMRRTIPPGRKLLYMLACIGIPLCIVFPAVIGADWPPARSQYALPLASSFMLFFLIKTYKKKAAAVVACLTLLVAAYQAQVTAQLFYSDHLRYNEDVRLAYELNSLITRVQPGNAKLPVALVGNYQTANRFNPNFLRGDLIGNSVFGIAPNAHGTTRRGLSFMKNMGINYDMPDEDQIERAYKEAVSMPAYPNPGCVRRVRDFIVIRISENFYE